MVADLRNHSRTGRVGHPHGNRDSRSEVRRARRADRIDEPTRDPGPGEVRVAVRAIGVNPIDVKVYSGAFGTDPAKLPIRLGAEAAGVVTAVGSGRRRPGRPDPGRRRGDRLPGRGAYASELVVPASSVVPKPAGLGWAEAGGLMISGATAIHLLAATDTKARRHRARPRCFRWRRADGGADRRRPRRARDRHREPVPARAAARARRRAGRVRRRA